MEKNIVINNHDKNSKMSNEIPPNGAKKGNFYF